VVENLWVSSRFKVITFNEIFPWQHSGLFPICQSEMISFIVYFWQTKTLHTDFSSRMPDCIKRGNCFATWKMSLFGGSNHHQGLRDFEFGKHAFCLHSGKKGVAIKRVSQKYVGILGQNLKR